MMTTLQQNFKQYFNILRILHLSLLATVVAFGVAVQFVLLPTGSFGSIENSGLYVNLAAGYMVFAIAIGYWLFGNQMKNAKAGNNLSDKLHTYRSASIIRWALLEGAALAALVFYLLCGSVVLLAVAGISLVVFLLLHPNVMRLKIDLDLSPAELARLDDPQDLVVQSPFIKRF